MLDSNIHDPVIARQTPRADFSIDQCWDEYTQDEHAVWDLLYSRQLEILAYRAAPEFLDGLKRLELSRMGIPNLKHLNPALKALTGWEIVMVPHLVPDDVFFRHLANRVVSSEAETNSITYKNLMFFMISSAMSPCSPIRFSPITCRPMVKEVSERLI